jgi:H+/Cl- antiporter ClcA
MNTTDLDVEKGALMDRLGFARSRQFWVRFGWGILLGLLSALGAYIFVAIMDFGINILWPEPPDAAFLSGSWQIVAIMTGAGFLVGLIYNFSNAREVNSILAMVKGDMDTRPVPAALLVSLISLVSGFSLGPEVPAGMIAGGLSTWVSKWRNLSDEIRKSNIVSGIVAAYSGVFTSPLAILMIPVELPHMQSIAYYGTLIIAAGAAVIGFVVFFAGEGFEFSGMLRLLDLPGYDFEVWHIAIGVVLGVIGALLTLIYGLTTKGLNRLVAPLNRMPIVRSTLGGLLLGLLGMALPLTLFLGSGGLVVVTGNAAALGVTLLIIYVFAKILATAGAQATGFIGGPIFPMFFIGGTAGTVVHLLFPQIPIALSVSTMMAAVPAALLPIPITLGLLTMLIAGLSITDAIPILVAALVGFLVVQGMGLIRGEHPEKQPNSGDQNPSPKG